MKKRTMAMMMALTMAAGVMTGCSQTSGAQKEATQKETTQKETTQKETAKEANAEETNNYADTITLVWYPNESADDFTASRDELARLIEQATGKEVEQKLTTDYAIAIEAVSGGTAQIGCVFGAEGYIQAKNANDAVNPLFVHTGASGTLDDAVYYSFFGVKEENAAEYKDGESFSIDNIEGKKISFVSNSSTSGFKVPTNSILTHFGSEEKWADLTVDDLLEGGSDGFFKEVLFGGSHQGSLYNLLSDKAEVAAFCDKEVVSYVNLKSGEDKQTGAVYEIKDGADAPFDTIAGSSYTVISSTPVMNGPFVYNSETLSPDDVEAIQKLFTSDEVTNNEIIFYPEGAEKKGLFKKSGDVKFTIVEDSWYDPIRNMQ